MSLYLCSLQLYTKKPERLNRARGLNFKKKKKNSKIREIQIWKDCLCKLERSETIKEENYIRNSCKDFYFKSFSFYDAT